MYDELMERVRRIHASIAQVRETDVTEVPVSTDTIGSTRFVAVNFRDGFTDEELSNRIHTAIHNVAHLPDHLRSWASQRGLNPELISAAITSSRALQILVDLSNNDKHGYPPRNGGKSGLAPRLTQLDRRMSMTTQAEAGSSVGFFLGPDGIGRITGSGTASIVITGTVVDRDNNRLGDLQELMNESIAVLEQLISKYAA